MGFGGFCVRLPENGDDFMRHARLCDKELPSMSGQEAFCMCHTQTFESRNSEEKKHIGH